MAFLDETGLAELWSLIQSEDSKITELTDTKAKIESGSYIGNGNAKVGNKNTLSFGFVPKVVIIVTGGVYGTASGSVFIQGQTTSNYIGYPNNTGVYVSLEWSGNKLSWYSDTADRQFNLSGKTYHYVVFG